MILVTDRGPYFRYMGLNIVEDELWWREIDLDYMYEDVKFHRYVFKINGKVFPWCTEEFKREFHKAKTWQVMKKG